MAASHRTYFVIFAVMRSGSNLLEKTLTQYDGIAGHGELFNPSFIGKPGVENLMGVSLSDREANPHQLIETLCAGNEENIPGFRIFDGHNERIEDKCLGDSACKKIILERDPVDSYVSLKAARKTNQWMLRNVTKRKNVRVAFDADEFSSYLAGLQEFYIQVRRRLQVSGETAFFLRYEDLHDRNILDGLVRFIGASGVRRDAKIPIHRQNPESLSERVENFQEMERTLDAMGISTDALPYGGEPLRGPAISQMVACRNAPVLMAVVPGCPSQIVWDWMQAISQISGDSKGSLLRPKNGKELNRWLSNMPGSECISMVRHPLDRAYDVFMRRIFEGGFAAIRRRLERHFALQVPDLQEISGPLENLSASGYAVADHRRAFATFLEFVRANLAGQTGIRTDAEWASQVSHLEGFSSVVPASRAVRQADLISELDFVSARLGVPKPVVGAISDDLPDGFRLADIYDARVEKLGRMAYAKDYLKLGFDDWRQGHRPG